MSSPSDSALDLLKRKRLAQMAAKQKQEQPVQVPIIQQQQQPAQMSSGGGAFSISDCDLGASPIMKGGLFPKAGGAAAVHNKMVSPLAQTRMLNLTKNPSQQQ